MLECSTKERLPLERDKMLSLPAKKPKAGVLQSKREGKGGRCEGDLNNLGSNQSPARRMVMYSGEEKKR